MDSTLRNKHDNKEKCIQEEFPLIRHHDQIIHVYHEFTIKSNQDDLKSNRNRTESLSIGLPIFPF